MICILLATKLYTSRLILAVELLPKNKVVDIISRSTAVALFIVFLQAGACLERQGAQNGHRYC